MNIFESNNVYDIELNRNESYVIYEFLTVSSYDRLYDDYAEYKSKIASDDTGRKGSGEKLHYSENLNRMKKGDRLVDIIIMNQLALGLLLEYYVKYCGGHKDGEVRIFKLTSILAYELYVTICERIMAETKDYDTKQKSVEPVPQTDMDKIIYRIKVLKVIEKKLYSLIGLKTMKIMENEYKKISIKEHLDYCLQEF